MATSSSSRPSVVPQRGTTFQADIADPRWEPLYTVGGVAALLSVGLVLAAIITHIIWPPPAWTPGSAARSCSSRSGMA